MSKAQFRNCASKRRFLTKAEAAVAANGKSLGVYACPICSGFHLTSSTRTSRVTSIPIEAEKPIFDGSLLARARWTRKA